MDEDDLSQPRAAASSDAGASPAAPATAVLPRRRKLRAAAGTVLSMLIAAAGVVGLLAFFAARDTAPVTTDPGPGTASPSQGMAHLRPGQPHPRYASEPPTSGAHVPVRVTADARRLSDDQILHALELGNVVFVYGSATPPPQLRAISTQLDARFTPELAALGQAVILARRPGTQGIEALAWRHVLRAPSTADPQLAAFASFWLGQPARG